MCVEKNTRRRRCEFSFVLIKFRTSLAATFLYEYINTEKPVVIILQRDNSSKHCRKIYGLHRNKNYATMSFYFRLLVIKRKVINFHARGFYDFSDWYSNQSRMFILLQWIRLQKCRFWANITFLQHLLRFGLLWFGNIGVDVQWTLFVSKRLKKFLKTHSVAIHSFIYFIIKSFIYSFTRSIS